MGPLMESEQKLQELLSHLYNQDQANWVLQKVRDIVQTVGHRDAIPFPDEKDVMVIAYGDHIQSEDQTPIATLHKFFKDNVGESVSSIHILPFYPYSSDDGFSVIDYKMVDPNLGTWQDVVAIGDDYKIMFDGVINHISSQSEWFKGFLADAEPFRDYFITSSPDADLSQVFRPRALPLLTEVKTKTSTKHVWTTFSPDQVDLNFHNPAVLVEILEVMAYYVSHNAKAIRLDAIAFAWKEPGSQCIHHENTHRIVKLLRLFCESIAPGVLIITETNVPHKDNIGYFGNGDDEAHLVYQFSLPPLMLHTIHKGDSRALQTWLSGLEFPGADTSFLNFLASHDGIGLMGSKGLISQQDRQDIAARCEEHGGLLSYWIANNCTVEASRTVLIGGWSRNVLATVGFTDFWVCNRFEQKDRGGWSHS